MLIICGSFSVDSLVEPGFHRGGRTGVTRVYDPCGAGLPVGHNTVMRNHWCSFAVAMTMTACSDSSPTTPTTPSSPEVSIRFVVTERASLSLSDPLACAGDWTTCPRGSQPQGADVGAVATRNYALPPGTYRLTGVLSASTASGASVEIQIGKSASASVGGGVAREGPVLGFVAFTGDPSSGTPSVVSRSCGATFSTPTAALEWSVTFRVVAGSGAVEPLCL